jgi:hypothetical protein
MHLGSFIDVCITLKWWLESKVLTTRTLRRLTHAMRTFLVLNAFLEYTCSGEAWEPHQIITSFALTSIATLCKLTISYPSYFRR